MIGRRAGEGEVEAPAVPGILVHRCRPTSLETQNQRERGEVVQWLFCFLVSGSDEISPEKREQRRRYFGRLERCSHDLSRGKGEGVLLKGESVSWWLALRWPGLRRPKYEGDMRSDCGWSSPGEERGRGRSGGEEEEKGAKN
ncbi:hypothetical protein HAX54_044814 [Datura stramonium]|uniref:Uncharacterized protein n=1 Tax=Datura stramonium TaxID=4076 RepID=A0ABS8WF71_DATST|nr:hypothetical protein [Datura stramonium]